MQAIRWVGLSFGRAPPESLTCAGAEVFCGDVNKLDHLRSTAEAADGVIHAAFNHDFSNLKQSSEDDRKVIETLGEVLAGSDWPLVITSRRLPRPIKDRRTSGRDRGHVNSAEFLRAASEEAAGALIRRAALPTALETGHSGAPPRRRRGRCCPARSCGL